MKNCAPSDHGFAFLKNSLNYFFYRLLVLTLFDGIELCDLHAVPCMGKKKKKKFLLSCRAGGEGICISERKENRELGIGNKVDDFRKIFKDNFLIRMIP